MGAESSASGAHPGDSLEIGQEVFHLLDLGRLRIDDCLRELDGIGVASVIDVGPGRLDGSLMMEDHPLKEQSRRFGPVGCFEGGQVILAYHTVSVIHVVRLLLGGIDAPILQRSCRGTEIMSLLLCRGSLE